MKREKKKKKTKRERKFLLARARYIRCVRYEAQRPHERRSCWACVLPETNSNARLLQPSQSSLQPRTFPPRRNYCPRRPSEPGSPCPLPSPVPGPLPLPLPLPDEETVMSRVRRKGKRNVFFLSTRWNAMARWIRGVPSRRAKPSVSQPRAARCWTKVGPRGAKGRPPRSLYGGAAPRPRSKTCRNGRKGCPPLAPPSANRHEDTTRRVLYISRVSEVSVTSTA